MTNTLIAKICAASTKVGALMPDKTNTAQNYSYISADKILERAGDALAELGVAILPAITQEDMKEVTYTDNYGKSKTRYDANVHFEMLVTDGEGELKAPWAGRGSDFSVPDKAMYKAITSGHKYFIAKLLNIGVGNEDGEHEEEPQASTRPQATQKPAAPRRSAPVEDDAIFEPAKPPHARLTPEQAAIIAHLARQVYGEKWEEDQGKLADWASKGTRNKLGDLYDVEAELLIKSLKKRVEQLDEKVAA